MYGMMPEREDREARQRAAREHVEHAQDAAAAGRWNSSREHGRVDARHRDVRADAEDERARPAGTAAAASGRRSAPVLPRREASSPSRRPSFFALRSASFFFGALLPPAPRRCRRPPRSPPAHPCSPDALQRELRASLPDRMTFADSARCGTRPLGLERGEVDLGSAFMPCRSDRRTSAPCVARQRRRSRAWAGGAAAASGRLRSRPCGSRPRAPSGPCGRGPRSCPARADAAADAVARLLGARRRLDDRSVRIAQLLHLHQVVTLLIMPRTAGVSTSSTVVVQPLQAQAAHRRDVLACSRWCSSPASP